MIIGAISSTKNDAAGPADPLSRQGLTPRESVRREMPQVRYVTLRRGRDHYAKRLFLKDAGLIVKVFELLRPQCGRNTAEGDRKRSREITAGF